MRSTTLLVALLALGLGFAVGRATAPRPDADLETLSSLHWALQERDWLKRAHRLSAFLDQLGPEELPATLEILEPYLPWMPTQELRLLMFAWTRFDAPGALEQSLQWPPRYRRNASGAAIYAWAFRDPEAAARALEAVEDREVKEFMRGRLIAGWVHGAQKETASAYIASLPDGPRRFNYVGTLAGELAREGPDAVVRWAEGVPETAPGYKADVFRQASATLAAIDPASTAEWLAPHLERDYAAGTLRVVARSWAGLDAAGALEWLASLDPDPGEDRRAAVFDAFSVWLERSPAEAEAWLEAWTPSEPLDPAVRALVKRSRDTSPIAALAWAARIESPELRDEVVVDVAREWKRRDAPELGTWLETGAVPGPVRRALVDAGLVPAHSRSEAVEAGEATPSP